MNPDNVTPIRTTLDAVVAGIKSELAAKDARIAELEAELAKAKPKAFKWKGAGLYRIRCGGVMYVEVNGRSGCGLTFCMKTGRYYSFCDSLIDLIEFIAPLGGQQ